MVETYKYKSKIATAISFLAAFVVYIGEPGLKQIIPPEYAFYIPILVLLCGYFVSQSTENKRVEVAEQMVHEQYDNNDIDVVDPTIPDEINDEDIIVGDDLDDGGC